MTPHEVPLGPELGLEGDDPGGGRPDPHQWADGVFSTVPYSDLPAVIQVQRDRQATCDRGADEAEEAGSRLDAIARTAHDLRHRLDDEARGVCVALGIGQALRYDDDFHKRKIGGVFDEEDDTCVTVWVDGRLEEDGATMREAFVGTLTEFDSWSEAGATRDTWGSEEIAPLAARMADAERSRARALRREADHMGDRAEALAQKRLHVGDPTAAAQPQASPTTEGEGSALDPERAAPERHGVDGHERSGTGEGAPVMRGYWAPVYADSLRSAYAQDPSRFRGRGRGAFKALRDAAGISVTEARTIKRAIGYEGSTEKGFDVFVAMLFRANHEDVPTEPQGGRDSGSGGDLEQG